MPYPVTLPLNFQANPRIHLTPSGNEYVTFLLATWLPVPGLQYYWIGQLFDFPNLRGPMGQQSIYMAFFINNQPKPTMGRLENMSSPVLLPGAASDLVQVLLSRILVQY